MVANISLSADPHALKAGIRQACSEYGFFLISDHGVSETLQKKLEDLTRVFFNLSLEEKMKISIKLGGPAWRGFFPVGYELTSGKSDLKEGIYFGEELGDGDPRVQNGMPLHGKNLFPELPGFREVVLEHQAAMTVLGHRLMNLISLSLGLEENYFLSTYTKDPTILFRIFHYPPSRPELDHEYPWGVGEHTDYGLLTILKQDQVGGLEIKSRDGDWLAVPPTPGTFVINIGDMLDFLTQGRYRSAPHRVRNTSNQERYSYPFFFDPGFEAQIESLPLNQRWDEENLYQFRGKYGDYLKNKVSKVFPDIAISELNSRSTSVR